MNSLNSIYPEPSLSTAAIILFTSSLVLAIPNEIKGFSNSSTPMLPLYYKNKQSPDPSSSSYLKYFLSSLIVSSSKSIILLFFFIIHFLNYFSLFKLKINLYTKNLDFSYNSLAFSFLSYFNPS